MVRMTMNDIIYENFEIDFSTWPPIGVEIHHFDRLCIVW